MCSVTMQIKRDVIVIGASKGGIEAVHSLVRSLPADLEAAVAVVVHTHPTSPRLLADIIGRDAALRTVYGTQGVKLERGHVYIAPPDLHLTVTALETFHLDHGPKLDFHRPAADALFQSAASVFGPRVIGVVLTGGEGDGTEGLKAIHAAGGVGIVQDPREAVAPSMPRHAITGDHPSFVVKLADMAELLVRLVQGDEQSVAASAPG